jgi:hypothetical protein
MRASMVGGGEMQSAARGRTSRLCFRRAMAPRQAGPHALSFCMGTRWWPRRSQPPRSPHSRRELRSHCLRKSLLRFSPTMRKHPFGYPNGKIEPPDGEAISRIEKGKALWREARRSQCHRFQRRPRVDGFARTSFGWRSAPFPRGTRSWSSNRWHTICSRPAPLHKSLLAMSLRHVVAGCPAGM